jgi:hypothetical protein
VTVRTCVTHCWSEVYKNVPNNSWYQALGGKPAISSLEAETGKVEGVALNMGEAGYGRQQKPPNRTRTQARGHSTDELDAGSFWSTQACSVNSRNAFTPGSES